jgi:hypothetical protein
LEPLATMRRECEVIYRNESDEEITAIDRIAYIYAQGKNDAPTLQNQSHPLCPPSKGGQLEWLVQSHPSRGSR